MIIGVVPSSRLCAHKSLLAPHAGEASGGDMLGCRDGHWLMGTPYATDATKHTPQLPPTMVRYSLARSSTPQCPTEALFEHVYSLVHIMQQLKISAVASAP